MKKLTILCLCLLLLTGCVTLPDRWAKLLPSSGSSAAEAPTPRPTSTAQPRATEPPQERALPLQTYEGNFLRFQAPGEWLRAQVENGVYFYPDPNDTDHTCLSCQELPNDMGLTETMVDIALLFSSADTLTSMVEGALAGSGITGFTLSPVAVEKTELNGVRCYRGASDVTVNGETYDFVGHVFLRGERMVLLIWVGEETAYAEGLKTVYDSLQAVR